MWKLHGPCDSLQATKWNRRGWSSRAWTRKEELGVSLSLQAGWTSKREKRNDSLNPGPRQMPTWRSPWRNLAHMWKEEKQRGSQAFPPIPTPFKPWSIGFVTSALSQFIRHQSLEVGKPWLMSLWMCTMWISTRIKQTHLKIDMFSHQDKVRFPFFFFAFLITKIWKDWYCPLLIKVGRKMFSEALKSVSYYSFLCRGVCLESFRVSTVHSLWASNPSWSAFSYGNTCSVQRWLQRDQSKGAWVGNDPMSEQVLQQGQRKGSNSKDLFL